MDKNEANKNKQTNEQTKNIEEEPPPRLNGEELQGEKNVTRFYYVIRAEKL